MSATKFNKRSWVEEMDSPQDDDCTSVNGSRNSSSRESSNSRKRPKRNKRNDKGRDADKTSQPKPSATLETDTSILQRRQKQIDYGKNTVGYHNYITQVPLDKRSKDHPKTPDKFTKYSRRSWDTLIKMWRIKLHEYDTDSGSEKDLNDIEVILEDDDDSDEKSD